MAANGFAATMALTNGTRESGRNTVMPAYAAIANARSVITSQPNALLVNFGNLLSTFRYSSVGALLSARFSLRLASSRQNSRQRIVALVTGVFVNISRC